MVSKHIVEKIKTQLKEKIGEFKSTPKLCIISVGKDDASQVYIKNKIKFWVIIGIILIITALIILNDNSFNLMGTGFIIIGLCLLILINQSKK